MRCRVLVAATGILLALAGSSLAASSTDPAKRRYESRYFKRPQHHRFDSTAKTRKFVPAPPLKTTVHRRQPDDVGPVRSARKPGSPAHGTRATSAAARPRRQDAATSPSGKGVSRSLSSSRASTLGKAGSGSSSSSTHSKGSCGWTIRTGAGKQSCK